MILLNIVPQSGFVLIVPLVRLSYISFLTLLAYSLVESRICHVRQGEAAREEGGGACMLGLPGVASKQVR